MLGWLRAARGRPPEVAARAADIAFVPVQRTGELIRADRCAKPGAARVCAIRSDADTRSPSGPTPVRRSADYPRTTSAICHAISSMEYSPVLMAILSASEGLYRRTSSALRLCQMAEIAGSADLQPADGSCAHGGAFRQLLLRQPRLPA